jgi:hypothetical protein
MRVYHGTDEFYQHLRRGTYVTKNKRDAWKFGFRRAYESGSPIVYIYTLEVSREDLKPDPKRNRAFTLDGPCVPDTFETQHTVEVPYNLRLYP